jgi:hypothetical protein
MFDLANCQCAYPLPVKPSSDFSQCIVHAYIGLDAFSYCDQNCIQTERDSASSLQHRSTTELHILNDAHLQIPGCSSGRGRHRKGNSWTGAPFPPPRALPWNECSSFVGLLVIHADVKTTC